MNGTKSTHAVLITLGLAALMALTRYSHFFLVIPPIGALRLIRRAHHPSAYEQLRVRCSSITQVYNNQVIIMRFAT